MNGRDRDKDGYASNRTSSSPRENSPTEKMSELSSQDMNRNIQNSSSQDPQKSAPNTAGKALDELSAQETHKSMPMQPDWLGRSLQQLYQETVEAPIPDSFKDLLDKLDLAEKKTNR